MVPLLALIAAFVLFQCLGFLWPYFANWHFALRAAFGVMFLLTASAHFGRRRRDLIRMVPEGAGDPATWVTVTGLAEIAIAVGLQLPRLADITAAAAIILLCCIFPANVKAAREHLTILYQPVPPIIPRLLIQLVLIGALAASVWRH